MKITVIGLSQLSELIKQQPFACQKILRLAGSFKCLICKRFKFELCQNAIYFWPTVFNKTQEFPAISTFYWLIVILHAIHIRIHTFWCRKKGMCWKRVMAVQVDSYSKDISSKTNYHLFSLQNQIDPNNSNCSLLSFGTREYKVKCSDIRPERASQR